MRSAAWVLMLACLTIGPARAAPTPTLYDVAVEIVDSSAAERARATRVALDTALVRLTGLVTLPSSPALEAARAAPDRYAIQFGLEERPGDDGAHTFLTVKFADASLLRLVEEAGLPLWSTNRPTLVVWTAVEEGSGRDVLGAGSAHPFVAALLERAAFRGLPVVLPAMDLDDALSVSPGVIWGGVTDVLDEASARYGAEGLLVVRLAADPRGFWSTRLLMRVPAGPSAGEEQLDWTTPSAEAAAERVVDRAVEALAARFSVAAGISGELRVRVDGIDDYGRYAAVLAYLGDLEFVDAVRVEAVEGHSLVLTIVTRTAWDRFRDLLDLDGRLVEQTDGGLGVEAGPGTAADVVPLVWRG